VTARGAGARRPAGCRGGGRRGAERRSWPSSSAGADARGGSRPAGPPAAPRGRRGSWPWATAGRRAGRPRRRVAAAGGAIRGLGRQFDAGAGLGRGRRSTPSARRRGSRRPPDPRRAPRRRGRRPLDRARCRPVPGAAGAPLGSRPSWRRSRPTPAAPRCLAGERAEAARRHAEGAACLRARRPGAGLLAARSGRVPRRCGWPAHRRRLRRRRWRCWRWPCCGLLAAACDAGRSKGASGRRPTRRKQERLSAAGHSGIRSGGRRGSRGCPARVARGARPGSGARRSAPSRRCSSAGRPAREAQAPACPGRRAARLAEPERQLVRAQRACDGRVCVTSAAGDADKLGAGWPRRRPSRPARGLVRRRARRAGRRWCRCGTALHGRDEGRGRRRAGRPTWRLPGRVARCSRLRRRSARATRPRASPRCAVAAPRIARRR